MLAGKENMGGIQTFSASFPSHFDFSLSLFSATGCPRIGQMLVFKIVTVSLIEFILSQYISLQEI